MFDRWLKLRPIQKSIHLQGPRRAGKSTLLQQIFPDYNYVTLDDLDDYSLSKSDPKGFVESLGAHFIIDEFQRVPELSLAVKRFIDTKKGWAILTGSTGIRIKDQSADTLAGRVELYQLPPCCWGEEVGPSTHNPLEEVLSQRDILIAQRKLASALKFGGFPEVISCTDDQEREHLLKNYKNTYFTRDLAQLVNIENVEALLALYQYLIMGIGSRYEYSNISSEIGISIPTVKKYLANLINSGLAFKLYGYHLGAAKRYVSSAKTYFCDNGIITSLNPEIDKGKKIEHFVVSEIEKRRKMGLFEAEQLFFYESTNGREIDLILEEKKQTYAIEIKASKNISKRDLRNLQDFKTKSSKTLKKVIFYLGTEFKTVEGIQIVPIANLYRSGGTQM